MDADCSSYTTETQKRYFFKNEHLAILYKMLSYRTETALQGAL